MNFWKPFKKTPEVPAPQVQVILPPPTLLKSLKWVVVGGKVGILTELDSSGYATVDLVDEEGLTYGNTRVHGGNVRLAKFLEIPAKRRPADPLYAATLGYL